MFWSCTVQTAEKSKFTFPPTLFSLTLNSYSKCLNTVHTLFHLVLMTALPSRCYCSCTILLGRHLSLSEVGSLVQGHTVTKKSRAGVELGQSGFRVCAPNPSPPTLPLIWGFPALGGGHLTKQHMEKDFNFASSKGENKKIFSPAA